MTDNPTQSTYDSLTQAYEHFNAALFGGQLPPCLITMQRRQGAFGFFAADRFASAGSPRTVIDEIALNPAHFAGRRQTAILATLAQEMGNVWQHHHGRKKWRSGYHNREWAMKMRQIGLVPSDTGKPGGKETGKRIFCYVEQGGAFEHACKAFLATREVVLYYDRENESGAVAKTTGKTQYACPNCRVNAWSKPGVSLRCGDCDRAMQVITKKREPKLLDGVCAFPA